MTINFFVKCQERRSVAKCQKMTGDTLLYRLYTYHRQKDVSNNHTHMPTYTYSSVSRIKKRNNRSKRFIEYDKQKQKIMKTFKWFTSYSYSNLNLFFFLRFMIILEDRNEEKNYDYYSSIICTNKKKKNVPSTSYYCPLANVIIELVTKRYETTTISSGNVTLKNRDEE